MAGAFQSFLQGANAGTAGRQRREQQQTADQLRQLSSGLYSAKPAEQQERVAKIASVAGPEYAANVQKVISGFSKEQRDHAARQNEQAVKLLVGVTSPEVYAQRRQMALQSGIPAEAIPEQFDPQWIEGKTQELMTIKDILAKGEPDKPTTELAKLIQDRDKLPPGHADRALYNSRISKIITSSDGITVSPDGTVRIGGPAGSGAPTKPLEKSDAKALEDSRTASAAAEPTEQLLSKAGAILDQGLDTGLFGEARMLWNRAGALLGAPGKENTAAMYEEFNSISKELGAQALQMFGGSDTERELAVAIETNVGLGKTNTTNRNIINRKQRAIDILQSKPDFESEWIKRNGSLVNPDQNSGDYFGKAWRRFQIESFGDSGSGGGDDSSSNDPLGLRR